MDKNNFASLPGIEPRFLSRPLSSLVTMLIELLGLIYIINTWLMKQQLFVNPPIHSFTGDRRNLTDPQYTNT